MIFQCGLEPVVIQRILIGFEAILEMYLPSDIIAIVVAASSSFQLEYFFHKKCFSM